MPFLAYFLVALACFIFIYNIKRTPKSTTHKKRTAPEPPGALPIIGHLALLKGSVHLARKLGTIADQIGPVFSLRLGTQRALVVNDWETVKECFTINDKNFATRYTHAAFTKYMGFDGAAFGLAPYGAFWRDIRKLISMKLFASQPIHKLRHFWNSEVNDLIRHLHTISQEKGHTVDLTKWLEHEMFNVLVAILCGKRLSSNEGDVEDWNIKKSIKKGLYLTGALIVSDFFPSLEWLDIGGHLKGFEQSSKELEVVAARWLDEHLTKQANGDFDKDSDFINVMLSTIPNETNAFGYTRDEVIKGTLVTLLLTGTESTTETVVWAFALLLNNPQAKKAVQDELDLHVGRNKWVQVSDLNKLEYLQAVVKETLRLYPPGPLAAPREAIDDCYVGGYYVPRGTHLIVNILKIQHDPKIWSDPYKFRPERFLNECKGMNYLGQNFEYIPFSAGRRMCPASIYALEVVHLTLARLLQAFDMSPPAGKQVDMSEGVGIALPKTTPLEAVVTPRLSPEFYQNL